MRSPAEVRSCIVCGCTDDNACVDPVTDEPCHWVAPRLCSACRAKVDQALHPWPDPAAPAVCEGCGCTAADPCTDPATGGPCLGPRNGLCDACSRVLLALAERG